MKEFVTSDGEIVQLSSSPYQVACTALVAFKLLAIETVAADPRLRKAPCTEVIIAFLSFVTVDKKTLKPKPVYASTNKLMARCGIRSKTTAKKARQLLVKYKYLVATGHATKDGCVKYRVENPHVDYVKMHVKEAEERLNEVDADRRKCERRKSRQPDSVVPTDDPTQNDRGINIWPHVGSENDPKYHRVILGEHLLEGDGDLEHLHPADSSSPLPIPQDDAEADRMIDFICEGIPVTMDLRIRLTEMLVAGVLSPHLASLLLSREKEAA